MPSGSQPVGGLGPGLSRYWCFEVHSIRPAGWYSGLFQTPRVRPGRARYLIGLLVAPGRTYRWVALPCLYRYLPEPPGTRVLTVMVEGYRVPGAGGFVSVPTWLGPRYCDYPSRPLRGPDASSLPWLPVLPAAGLLLLPVVCAMCIPKAGLYLVY